MDPYLTDEERWQQVKDWWKSNGTMLLVGVSIGLLVVFGWRNYQDGSSNKAIAASTSFEVLKRQMILRSPQFAMQKKGIDQDKLKEVAVTSSKKIIAQYPSTPYATDAKLLLAKINVESDDLVAAQNNLENALKSLDKTNLKFYIVKMRLARVLRDKGSHKEALAHLKVNPPIAFKKYFEYIKGTIREGKKECVFAVNNYKNALKIINEEHEKAKKKPVQSEFKQLVEHRLENVRNC